MKLAVLALPVLILITGCSGGSPDANPTNAPPGMTSTALPPRPTGGPTGVSLPSTAPGPAFTADRYVELANALHKRGVAIWWETDLVARWLEGPGSFDQAIDRLGALGKVPGVVGFKVSDEIGYHDGLQTVAEAAQFLRAAKTRLAQVAPGKQLLVDAVVPELGCLPWRGTNQQGCAQRVRLKYPAATAAALEGYLRAGLIDRLDLSTGLLEEATYAKWGLTKREAQVDVWNRVKAQGWPQLTILQARKALAEPDGYQGDTGQANDDAVTYIDVPVAAGARAVDIWTWRQQYQGNVVSLLGPGLSGNPLWTELIRRRADGRQLITHMTPSQLPADSAAFGHECDLAAAAFSAVFVAAGTG
ncbi:hypothetical protein EV138_6395 [Kribbella voronezhensis]|uniref:Glycosyl hydrolase family 10 n=1 Tax=Kribbella voronezhensis TaxID=2512212 RepID=A0A4R7SXD9_9ACTN|nr:hypothetical protein [Kribbella voronezhensis]TDU83931.1 hypothetical protein EV138_6395 [Kribbella voronezhensis]